MSAATMLAAHAVIMNGNRRYGGGGGGGGGNQDDDYSTYWVIGIGIAIILCIFGFLIHIDSYDRELPPYVVHGTLHSYETQTYSKKKRIYVNILQSDGKIREYRTTYEPHECYKRTTAVYMPVKVTPTYNDWTKNTRYDSQLMLDACAK